MRKPVLWIIIPCFNEEEVLPKTIPLFIDKINELVKKNIIDNNSAVLLVNDGSFDNTWDLIKDFSRDKKVLGISQSRNRGHQNAVLAGLMEAKDKCDITISIDCDGQDDINAIDDMIKEYYSGYDIVYGVRSDRSSDSFFKRFTAQTYYKLLRLMDVDVVYNHADYRLVSSRVIEEFAAFKEVNLFLRGMFPLVGFKSTSVYYKREERVAGKSHYSFAKMIGLAVDGITSLSVKPIRFIAGAGLIFSFIGFLGVLWVIIRTMLGYDTVNGWSSLVCLVIILGGLNLFSIGMIGEYIGKIYLEVKRRPRYIISERTWENLDSRK